ncbi:MAG: hypothetical protein IJS62_09130 [Bacteroidales bacterium]|nr:hypothetical protein [Bacteroidales bacterium]
MKKNLFALCALAAIAAGCAKNVIQEPVEGGTTVISATMADDPVEARTAIGEKTGTSYPIIWTAGDCISVNGCPSTALTEASISNNGKNATFEIEGLVSAPFTGVYPLSAVASYTDGAYKVTLPQVQHYTAGSFDPAAAVMLASGSSSLSFQNALAYLKVKVTEGSDAATIKSMKLAAGNGEALSGTFSAVFGETCSITATGSGSGVTLDCGDGVALGEELILAIPARTYAQGFVITVITTANKYQQVASSASFTAEAGKLYSTSFAYAEGGDYSSGIWTEEDLIAFLAAADGGVDGTYNTSQLDKTTASFGDYSQWVDTDGKVHLKADITLSQPVDWSKSVENRKNSVTNFDGYFDGEGHTITIASGTTWRTPLFINVWGTIANLTIAGEMRNDHAPELGSALVHALQEGGVLDNCTNRADITYDTVDQENWKNVFVAGLVALTSKATVTGCTNYGTLNVTGKAQNLARVGGVAVYADYETVITGCTNYGEIIGSTYSFEGNRIAEVGGVVGYAAHNASVTNCYNRAAVFNTGKAKQVGGVIASARTDLSGLHNYAPIVQGDDNDSTTVGGVINWIGAGYTLSNSTNNAALTAGKAKEIGGVILTVYGSARNCTNNGTIYASNRSTVVGGVARTVESAGVLENCTNAADFLVMSAYLAGVVAKNQGTVTGCTNNGNISFGATKCRAAGIAYDNKAIMTDCVNNGSIDCDQTFCNIGGIICRNSYTTSDSVNTYATLTNCDNNGTITVTGENSRAAGICFNMVGGTIKDCDNTADVTIDLVPVSAGVVEFASGVVGIVSRQDLSVTDVANIFSNATGSYSPVSTYKQNIHESKLLIENCTNTGHIKIKAAPASSSAFLRNVAIGGIVGWNWGATTDDAYLEIKDCTNGDPQATTDTDYYYVQFQQSVNPPSYLAPALGGIIGQSAPYNAGSGGVTISPYTEGYATSSWRDGMKLVIDGCKSYGVVANGDSWSGGAGFTTRAIRGSGGIGGLLYGSKDEGQSVIVRNCTSNAYVFMGPIKGKNGFTPSSKSNCVGGIAGCAAYVDVDNCTVKGQVGSTTRFILAAGGIFGTCIERFSITNCSLEMPMGYCNNQQRQHWGLAVGGIVAFPTAAARNQGYATLSGSVISNNVFKPGTVNEWVLNGNDDVIASHAVEIDAANFRNYIICAADAANNATNGWLTMSGNTFGD